MTFLWLVAWICSGAPSLVFDPWNNWAIALAVCLAIDILGGGGNAIRRRQ